MGQQYIKDMSLESLKAINDMFTEIYKRIAMNKTSGDIEFLPDKMIKHSIGAKAYLSGDDTITSGSWQKVNLNLEFYDLGSDFNISTYKFIVPVSGYYAISVNAILTTASGDYKYGIGIWVNGVDVTLKEITHSVNNDRACPGITDFIHLNKDDYVEMYVYQNTGIDRVVKADDGEYTFMSIHLLNKD